MLISLSLTHTMAFKARIFAFDCGNKVTGIAGIELQNDDTIKILYLNCVETSLNDVDLSNIIKGFENISHVVYENTFMYKNWVIMQKQKQVRKFFLERNIHVKALHPSQKAFMQKSVGKKSKDRKKMAVQSAKEFLKDHGDWYDTFNAFERNHDIADALLMAIYASKTFVGNETNKKLKKSSREKSNKL